MTIEKSMVEHYKYIIEIKEEELAEINKDVEYREQELKQLIETLNNMTIV